MDLTKTSRFISLILRHKPWVAGIDLDEHGWADVEELIQGVREKISPRQTNLGGNRQDGQQTALFFQRR
mgnify:CR=1 FL=1